MNEADRRRKVYEQLRTLPAGVALCLRSNIERRWEADDTTVTMLEGDINALAGALAAYNRLCERARILEQMVADDPPERARRIWLSGDDEPPFVFMWDSRDLPWQRTPAGWEPLQPHRRWGLWGKITRYSRRPSGIGAMPVSWRTLIAERGFMASESRDGHVTPLGMESPEAQRPVAG